MPRKYHRPPTTKRRKTTRKTAIPYEGGPIDGGVETDIVTDDEALDDDAPLVAVDVSPNIPEEEDERPLTVTRSRAPGAPERHVNRDYSYVRSEIIRIAAIVVFLVVALSVTAYFRN